VFKLVILCRAYEVLVSSYGFAELESRAQSVNLPEVMSLIQGRIVFFGVSDTQKLFRGQSGPA
jgi:hypothetical protein